MISDWPRGSASIFCRPVSSGDVTQMDSVKSSWPTRWSVQPIFEVFVRIPSNKEVAAFPKSSAATTDSLRSRSPSQCRFQLVFVSRRLNEARSLASLALAQRLGFCGYPILSVQ